MILIEVAGDLEMHIDGQPVNALLARKALCYN